MSWSRRSSDFRPNGGAIGPVKKEPVGCDLVMFPLVPVNRFFSCDTLSVTQDRPAEECASRARGHLCRVELCRRYGSEDGSDVNLTEPGSVNAAPVSPNSPPPPRRQPRHLRRAFSRAGPVGIMTCETTRRTRGPESPSCGPGWEPLADVTFLFFRPGAVEGLADGQMRRGSGIKTYTISSTMRTHAWREARIARDLRESAFRHAT